MENSNNTAQRHAFIETLKTLPYKKFFLSFVLLGIVVIIIGAIKPKQTPYTPVPKETPFKKSYWDDPLQERSYRFTKHSIPDVDLSFLLPAEFKQSEMFDKDGKRLYAAMQSEAKPKLNFRKPNSREYDESVTVYVERTQLLPKEWLHENVILQGEKMKHERIADPITINNYKVTITGTSCCGDYTPTYIIEYVNHKQERVLVIFTTDSKQGGKVTQNDPFTTENYLLDFIIETLESTT